jgi:3-phenylpropionate/cinnamic acid dioxygenase small subunit
MYQRIPINERIALQYEVEQWLYHEAELLDSWDFDGWLDLFTDDAVYEMPIRLNMDGWRQPDVSFDFLIFDDDRETLQIRVDRLKTEFAWAEIPPSRTRRFVTNVRIQEVDPNQSLMVRSHLLIYRSRAGDPKVDLVSGERYDTLRVQEGSLKLARRVFIVDQASINTRNLAIFV